MHKIIGQEKLVTRLKSYTFQTLPNAMLLIGEKGSGKHFISNCLANHLGVELIKLDTTTLHDTLIEYSQCNIPKIYLIDLSTVVEKQQNKFLKFIEEPAPTVRVILLAESDAGILPTILNRCITYRLEEYTIDQLKQFEWVTGNYSELVYKFCKTPGQLLNIENEEVLINLQKTFKNLLNNILTTSYADLLNVVNKINFKEDYNKFNFDLFLTALIQTAYDNFIEENNVLSFKIYKYLINKKQLMSKNLNKESFLLQLLEELWRKLH
jgi:DNA polymerase III delta prime subunit